MFKRIKAFFIGVSVAVLGAVLFVIRQNIVARQLKKQLIKQYSNKTKIIDDKIIKLTKRALDQKISIKAFTEKKQNLTTKKEEINEKTNKVSADELVTSIDKWFKSNRNK